MEILNIIIDRWKAKTPAFFTQIKRLMFGIASSAFAIWGANQTMGLDLPPMILNLCKYVIAFAAASGLTAQLTRENPTTNQ